MNIAAKAGVDWAKRNKRQGDRPLRNIGQIVWNDVLEYNGFEIGYNGFERGGIKLSVQM